MKKKIEKMLRFIGTKKIIAICALVVVIVAICIGFAINKSSKSSKSDKQQEVSVEQEQDSTGLQIQESAEVDDDNSIDFSEFLTEEEKKDTEKGEEGKGSDSKEEQKLESVTTTKESKKGYIINIKEDAFKDLDPEVVDTIKELKEGKKSSLPAEIQEELKDKVLACDIFDLTPEEGQTKDEDGYYTVELTVSNLSKRFSKVLVLHYSEVQKTWEVIEPAKIDGDVITVRFADLSPVVIYGEEIKSSDSTDNGGDTGNNGDSGQDSTGKSGSDFGQLF